VIVTPPSSRNIATQVVQPRLTKLVLRRRHQSRFFDTELTIGPWRKPASIRLGLSGFRGRGTKFVLRRGIALCMNPASKRGHPALCRSNHLRMTTSWVRRPERDSLVVLELLEAHPPPNEKLLAAARALKGE